MTKKKDDEMQEAAVESSEENVETKEIVKENPEKEQKKKSSRKKPAKKRSGKEKPEWVNYEKEEVEKLILKLAQGGRSKSHIGLMLRDQYGIPDVKVFGITIGKVLAKEKIGGEIPEDLYNIMKKAVVMHNHLGKNKKDKKGIHTLQLIESRARKLGRYYSSIGRLPSDWRYDINKAKLIVK